MENYIVIYVTAKDNEEAELIANGLVKSELAACVNILPSIKSIYKWKEEICVDKEALLIIKSRKSLMGKIIAFVQERHSYENPEIIALPILDGSEDYLKWIDDSCSEDE